MAPPFLPPELVRGDRAGAALRPVVLLVLLPPLGAPWELAAALGAAAVPMLELKEHSAGPPLGPGDKTRNCR